MGMRAAAKDFETAQLMGVKINSVISFTFIVGSFLAAVGSILYFTNYPSVAITSGSLPGLRAFIAAVFGGIGSIPGALIGGLLLGVIEILGKARGSRQGNNLLVEKIQAAGGVDFDKPLLLGYTGMSDVLLQKYIRDSAFLWADHLVDLPQTIIGSVVGTHAGPGAVAVAFFAKQA